VNRLLRSLAAGAALVAAAPGVHAQDADQEAAWRNAPGVDAVGVADRVYGPAKADFSLIVWLDPECPYCRQIGAMPERVVEAANGRLNLAVRLYPLPFHGANAMIASASALCVADQTGADGFYRFLDGYLAMTGANGKGLPGTEADGVVALARAAGARDGQALTTCSHDNATAQRLSAEMKAADRAGISGTPTFAIRNNRTGETLMAEGALAETDVKAAVNAMASRAGG